MRKSADINFCSLQYGKTHIVYVHTSHAHIDMHTKRKGRKKMAGAMSGGTRLLSLLLREYRKRNQVKDQTIQNEFKTSLNNLFRICFKRKC